MTQESQNVSPTLWARGGKRAFDVVGAVALIIYLFPGVIVAGLLMKLTSRGPLLFSQDRAGKDGAVFRLIKLRTMRGGRKPDPKELVPLDHPEITPVGRWLRRLKIDELPQLLHVLSGKMSLVGPRPTLPDQVQAYDAFRRRRLLVRPGVTGLAQVYGHSMMPWDERILYDIAYVRRCSFTLDMHILFRTMWVLLAGERNTTRPFKDTIYAQYVTPPDGYISDQTSRDPA